MTEEQFPTDDYVETPINHKAEVQFRTLKVGYHKESYVYAGIFKKKIEDDDVIYIADKITRHFKLPKIRYEFSRRKSEGSGVAYKNYNLIRLSYNTNFGTLCHEINHFICYRIEKTKDKKRIRHGTKIWNRNFQRLMKYCIKNRNFWEQELKEREQRDIQRQLKEIEDRKKHKEEEKIKLALQSLEKTKPTKEDKKKQKITTIEKRIKGYNRKIKLNQTLLKKANRRLKNLLK